MDPNPSQDNSVTFIILESYRKTGRFSIRVDVETYVSSKFITLTLSHNLSLKQQRPFAFQLHKGQVIMAWDLGISTMSKGEKAVLTCSPDYAYGSRGAGGVIPPNATLIFEVDLLEFKDDDRMPISWSVTLLICLIPILMVCLKFGIISFD